MKRFFAAVTVFAAVLAGCVPKQYRGREIVRIEYVGSVGMGLAGTFYEKTFDFESLTAVEVYRMEETELEAELEQRRQAGAHEESLENFAATFNNPVVVSVFDEENKEAFLKELVRKGVYDWDDAYETDEPVMDGAGFTVTLVFGDGGQKATRFYYKEPFNFGAIEKLFTKYLGTELYYTGEKAA